MILAYLYGNAEWIFAAAVVVFFAVSFLSMQFIIKKYITDRIKPVYNTIRGLPLSGKKMKERSMNSNNLLRNVKDEVEEWAKTQMKEIERLKELERYRKEFVGNVSHELKTPIFNRTMKLRA